jgi:hypothetical protein
VKGFFFLFFIWSCSGLPGNSQSKEAKTSYSFTDVSGTFKYNREQKVLKKKLVSRGILSYPASQKTVEKSVAVSQIGTIKDKAGRLLTVRPFASEFAVWLEGKKYSSTMRLNAKNRTMVVNLQSPEPQWKGTKEWPFPRGKYFCFFSQIPECLYHNKFLQKSEKSKKRMSFYVVWDSYPYIQEQLTGVGKNLFAPASVKFDGEIKKDLRYAVEVEDQVIFYSFSKSYALTRIAWISQGITIVPWGEESPNDE